MNRILFSSFNLLLLLLTIEAMENDFFEELFLEELQIIPSKPLGIQENDGINTLIETTYCLTPPLSSMEYSNSLQAQEPLHHIPTRRILPPRKAKEIVKHHEESILDANNQNEKGNDSDDDRSYNTYSPSSENEDSTEAACVKKPYLKHHIPHLSVIRCSEAKKIALHLDMKPDVVPECIQKLSDQIPQNKNAERRYICDARHPLRKKVPWADNVMKFSMKNKRDKKRKRSV